MSCTGENDLIQSVTHPLTHFECSMFPGPVPPKNRQRESSTERPTASQTAPTPPAEPPTDLDSQVAAVREGLNREDPKTSRQRSFGILLLTLGLFFAAIAFDRLQTAIIILVVLLIHELGHLIGMKAFGYRDIRMFFIPFFGAAATGRKESAPAWQESIVLLLGPLPGIALGLVLHAILHPLPSTWQYELIAALVLINAFNLFPLVPLDGGRLLEVLVFGRHPVLGAAFRLLAAAGLGFVAWDADLLPLWLLAGLILLTTPAVYNQGVSAARIRRIHPDLPAEATALTELQLRDIVREAATIRPSDRDPDHLASRSRTIFGLAATRRAGPLAVILFLALYVLGFAAALFYLSLTSIAAR